MNPLDRSPLPYENEKGRAVTWRALALGAVMALLLGLFAGYTEMMIKSSPMANDFTAAAALYMMVLLLAAVHLPLKLLARRFALSTAELATVYVMMLVAAAVPTRGLVEFVGPIVTSARYFADEVNRWGEYFFPYLDRLPWIGPQEMSAVRGYFDGLPEGAAVPWGAWALPATMWLLFCLAMALGMICVAVILRRQWMEHERLVYPMMQAPLDLIRSAGSGAAGPQGNVWKNRLLWLGFAIPFVYFSITALGHEAYLPHLFPRMTRFHRVFFLERMVSVEFRFSPITLGFMYFVRMDVLMGLWASSLALSVLFGWLRFLGAYPSLPKIGIWSYDTVRAFTGAGALLVFMAVVLYRGRKHLAAVFRGAFRRQEPEESRQEIMSYRAAVVWLFLSGAFMFAWLVATGLAWWQAAVFLLLCLLIFAALTRLVTEAGLPTAMTPMCAGDFMVGLFGTGAFTTRNLVGMGLTYPYHSEMRTSVMALVANGLKVFHETVTSKRRRLLPGLLLAVTLSYAGSMALMIHYPYRRGGLNLDRFAFDTSARYPWRDAALRIEEPWGPMWRAYGWMVGGGAAMAALLAATHFIPGWPLHPIGVITSFHWAGRVLFSSALFVWVGKGLMLKYGGPWLYRRMRPFFVGLVLGEVFVAGMWATIDMFLDTQYNNITSMF